MECVTHMGIPLPFYSHSIVAQGQISLNLLNFCVSRQHNEESCVSYVIGRSLGIVSL